MGDLQQGGNAPVSGNDVAVTIEWTAASGVEADVSAYLLTETGKVRGDHDMVFYNQKQGGSGAVNYIPGHGRGVFEVALGALPAEIVRIVFCVTIDEAAARRQTLAQVSNAKIGVGPKGGASDTSFAPVLTGASEAAMTFGELYKRNGQWKFRAVGQGFNGGLGPLARSFGIDVAEAASPAPSAPPPPPPPPAAAKPINLSKVSLDKPGQSISLEKRGASFGEIKINLNWSRGKKGLFGGGNAIDLDLGCLFEMANGDKHVIQALGRLFGSFDAWPYIALSGDDRTGDVAAGETMRINGARWNDIRRLIVFANIYDGVPKWNMTDGVVTVTMPDQPPIEVRMTDGRDSMRLCGIVLLENVGGTMKASRIVDYFRGPVELDRAFGWNMNWQAGGRKD